MSRQRHHTKLSIATIALGLLTAAPLHGQPLPTPEGAFAVGYWRTTVQRPLSAQHGRRLLLEIWYPSDSSATGRRAKPYTSPAIAAALSRQLGLVPRWAEDVGTHATEGLQPARGTHPVVVFSHGLSWPVALYQSLLTQLASEGYVVVGVNHPGGTVVEYETGDLQPFEPMPPTETPAAQDSLLARRLVAWTADVDAVLRMLPSWAREADRTPLAGHLDSTRIALMGHSFGASAVAHLSGAAGVRAVVLMEGKLRDTAATELEIRAPLLHLIGEYNRLELEGRSYRPSRSAPVYQAVVAGTGHAYFSDLILLYKRTASADWLSRHRYELEPQRILQITRDYTSAFLGRYLSGREHSLLNPVSYSASVLGPRTGGYPEVTLYIDVW